MVTNNDTYEGYNYTKFELSGLSTDTKPTLTFNEKKIANGSTFFEIDTKDVKFYDADSDTWV